MKVVLLCNVSGNQRALAHRLAQRFALAAIGVIAIPPPSKPVPFLGKLALAAVGLPFRRAWFGMLGHYDRLFPAFPDVPLSRHQGVNSASVVSLIEAERPDLVLVSGTDLLRKPLIDRIMESGRIMNLHTGLSPYIKGGPNCTNWALALGEFDMIGNTIMWLDAGIDSGNIVATERTPLDGRESLLDLHIKVMDHAHDLYVRAVAAAVAGADLPSVPQDRIDKGRLFLTKHWTTARSARALFNFLARYRPAALAAQRQLELIALGRID